ncbi:MAG: hypothetical protein ROY99_09405 [Ignavibacterium sp.]|jgi:hypothetical protein|nr:hypothetical protein [Ignavibacterium sp.]
MKLFYKLKTNISFIIPAIILILINYLFTKVALLNTFGYEFAAVNGLLFVVIAGLFTFNKTQKAEFNLKNILYNLLVFFSLPLIITLINSLFTMFCSFWDGLLFYLLIALPSLLLGFSLALLIGFYFKRLKRTIFIFTLIWLVLIPVVEIYFYPQIYFYSPLIGFFPGNIYDEGLSPDWKLVWHQLIVLFFSITIVRLIYKKPKPLLNNRNKFISGVILLFIVFQFLSPFLGFSTSFYKLNNILEKKIETENFILHYDKLTDDEVEYISLSQEYYFFILKDYLKVSPSKKINVYIFNNREQKKNLFGAGNADVTKPWQYTAYLSADSWDNTLKHELVHIFSAEFGTGIFKLAGGFNPALIEGVAKAVEGISYDYELIDFTALAYNNNYRLKIVPLFSGFNFFRSNAALGYTYSGAFIKYLIDKYGLIKVKEFYSTNDFESVFNKKLEDEEKLFEEYLSMLPAFAGQEMADYYFGRLSIIQKICPRFISDRITEAYNYLAEGNLSKAEKLFTEVNYKAIDYSALIGLSETYHKKKETYKAIKLLSEDNLKKFTNSPYEYLLMLRLGDLNALNDMYPIAGIIYQKIIESNPSFNLVSLSKNRLKLLDKDLLKTYLEGNDSLKYTILTSINKDSLDYNLIPSILNLSNGMNINYKQIIKNFNKTFVIDNLESSYAAYKLSDFMLANKDYANARKYSALALRYKNQNPFYFAVKQNFNKTNWFFNNADSFINKNITDTTNVIN